MSKIKAHKKKNHEAMQKYKNNMEQKHTNSWQNLRTWKNS